jgi:hypothetical protein
LLSLALVLVLDRFDLRNRWVAFADTRPGVVRWTTYGSVVILFLTFHGASNPEFVYFQF